MNSDDQLVESPMTVFPHYHQIFKNSHIKVDFRFGFSTKRLF